MCQRFSALQRAENSSIIVWRSAESLKLPFQCSSASRKFLNYFSTQRTMVNYLKFQCSSASRKFLNLTAITCQRRDWQVSVLFSEPKIPQFVPISDAYCAASSFSALQRAENSSILPLSCKIPTVFQFQCSSASRKFLNSSP